ncbi:MAG: endo-1,4-beta-xylanase, partial [Victivallales bacterium]|nr:endo-1,4-beta-xylanase [Victivallales bacterium]
IAYEKACLDKRFRELAERYAKRIRDWEVTNETFRGSQPERYGHFFEEDDFIEWSFAEAERFFPANQLVINEDKPHTFGNFLKSRSAYYLQIERALLKGARIDKIGMQFHMFHRAEQELEAARKYYDPELIFNVLDTYARFNKPIQITESTIPAYSGDAADEELQMEIIYNLYRMWFSHPATEAIIYWNLVDGFAHGAVPGDMTFGENYYYGGLIRYDFTPKPAYEMICNLFQKQYHTELELDAVNGEASFKGFYGDYDIEVATDGGVATRPLSLLKNISNKFEIKL